MIKIFMEAVLLEGTEGVEVKDFEVEWWVMAIKASFMIQLERRGG